MTRLVWVAFWCAVAVDAGSTPRPSNLVRYKHDRTHGGRASSGCSDRRLLSVDEQQVHEDAGPINVGGAIVGDFRVGDQTLPLALAMDFDFVTLASDRSPASPLFHPDASIVSEASPLHVWLSAYESERFTCLRRVLPTISGQTDFNSSFIEMQVGSQTFPRVPFRFFGNLGEWSSGILCPFVGFLGLSTKSELLPQIWQHTERRTLDLFLNSSGEGEITFGEAPSAGLTDISTSMGPEDVAWGSRVSLSIASFAVGTSTGMVSERVLFSCFGDSAIGRGCTFQAVVPGFFRFDSPGTVVPSFVWSNLVPAMKRYLGESAPSDSFFEGRTGVPVSLVSSFPWLLLLLSPAVHLRIPPEAYLIAEHNSVFFAISGSSKSSYIALGAGVLRGVHLHEERPTDAALRWSLRQTESDPLASTAAATIVVGATAAVSPSSQSVVACAVGDLPVLTSHANTPDHFYATKGYLIPAQSEATCRQSGAECYGNLCTGALCYGTATAYPKAARSLNCHCNADNVLGFYYYRRFKMYSRECTVSHSTCPHSDGRFAMYLPDQPLWRPPLGHGCFLPKAQSDGQRALPYGAAQALHLLSGTPAPGSRARTMSVRLRVPDTGVYHIMARAFFGSCPYRRVVPDEYRDDSINPHCNWAYQAPTPVLSASGGTCLSSAGSLSNFWHYVGQAGTYNGPDSSGMQMYQFLNVAPDVDYNDLYSGGTPTPCRCPSVDAACQDKDLDRCGVVDTQDMAPSLLETNAPGCEVTLEVASEWLYMLDYFHLVPVHSYTDSDTDLRGGRSPPPAIDYGVSEIASERVIHRKGTTIPPLQEGSRFDAVTTTDTPQGGSDRTDAATVVLVGLGGVLLGMVMGGVGVTVWRRRRRRAAGEDVELEIHATE